MKHVGRETRGLSCARWARRPRQLGEPLLRVCMHRARWPRGWQPPWACLVWSAGPMFWVLLGRHGPSQLGLAWVCIGFKMGLKNGFKKCMGLGPNQNNNNKNTIEWNKKKNKVAINKYARTISNTIFKNTKKTFNTNTFNRQYLKHETKLNLT